MHNIANILWVSEFMLSESSMKSTKINAPQILARSQYRSVHFFDYSNIYTST